MGAVALASGRGRDSVLLPRRAVLDTSVLVPPGLRRDLQQAAQLGLFTALWSPWIIAELNRVLTWHWVRRRTGGDTSRENERMCREAANQMMGHLLPVVAVVTPLPPYPPPWKSLADQWDYPIWAAAVVGHAHYVLSENTRHYPPRHVDGRHVYEGVEYLSGYAFLDLLLAGPN